MSVLINPPNSTAHGTVLNFLMFNLWFLNFLSLKQSVFATVTVIYCWLKHSYVLLGLISNSSLIINETFLCKKYYKIVPPNEYLLDSEIRGVSYSLHFLKFSNKYIHINYFLTSHGSWQNHKLYSMCKTRF